MLEHIDINNLISTYAIPWSINIGLAILIFIVGRFISKLLVRVSKRIMQSMNFDRIIVNFVGTIVYILLIFFVIIAALSRLGIDTTYAVAIFGAAGLAVGLALKDSLANFANGVMLILLQPFKEGDIVETAGVKGFVETVSIFSTTIITPDNREIIVPNGLLYSDVIINYSSNDTRRIDLVIGISYEDDITRARSVIRGVLESDNRVLREPETAILVGELADSSVNIFVRPWVKTTDYLDVKYEITEKIKTTLDQNGITIPFPQRDVHLYKDQD